MAEVVPVEISRPPHRPTIADLSAGAYRILSWAEILGFPGPALGLSGHGSRCSVNVLMFPASNLQAVQILGGLRRLMTPRHEHSVGARDGRVHASGSTLTPLTIQK